MSKVNIVEEKIDKGIILRKCNGCTEWLSRCCYYSKNKNNPDWIDSVCKSCRKNKSTKRQVEKKDEIKVKKRVKKLKNKGIQSPFNYMANKYSLLNQIKKLLPSEIGTFVDLFGGSATVTVNVDADKYIYNEIDSNVVSFYNAVKHKSVEELIQSIDFIINEYSLNDLIVDNFYKLRSDFNSDSYDYAKFYALVAYSFNQHPLYKKNGDYVTGWGKGLTHFNDQLRLRFYEFKNKIDELDISIHNLDFRELDLQKLTTKDVVYVDPPYLASKGTYDWSEKDELDLLDLLDKLNENNVKFALSNVLIHKGVHNSTLAEWSCKYKVHNIDADYNRINRGTLVDDTVEVLITNY